ncbi:alpha-ketoglutarate-dependent 2,4-dichlorophenoxyacetate dioxygenase [Fomitiporia mediterranea MF3/22]|uniref:alpha-ketoglutarate-dependent 2,4-dichlorophenoxyacetate dioxygenase n=1 Tax=Fomitiporia mediterranea (strain MF3/22) TaxID=694068 RepID=UPI0004408819|nr:alpha-ketoglutarate-dependent 2,4-dichlorophenoxyacetate dioxygenase [Fomitiporia mediterranea MF3/22]EJD04872.1 alpha-ketoglutarate-dependent 2,4-dichlorophenoxyacetate dioxygenase [Fomitiporia mediterranea MF3/22]
MATLTATVAPNKMNSATGHFSLNALEPVKIGSLVCKPLHPTFGAEVEGVDFSKPVSEEQIKDIIAAQNRQRMPHPASSRFGVTIYRNTDLTDETHIAFSHRLGELEKVPQIRNLSIPDRFSYPELFDIGNTNADGSIFKKDDRRWWFNKGNALWHTDSSFNQHRAKYSLLLAHVIPKNGGDTAYADVRAAYRDLPEDQKAKLRGLVCKHDLWHSRQLAAPEEFKSITEDEKSSKKPSYHKLVQVAPDGEETLYIASHISEVVGMPKEEGSKLIRELIEHCTQPQYTLIVKWHQPGDLVFWDDRCTMHRATSFSDQSEVRDMRRTTVYDDGPYQNGVPEAAYVEA